MGEQKERDCVVCMDTEGPSLQGYYAGLVTPPAASAGSIALQDVLAELMVRAPGIALEAASASGYNAGERYAANCLDIQRPHSVLFSQLVDAMREIGAADFDVYPEEGMSGRIAAVFNRLCCCRGSNKGIPSMQCAFMRNFWQGALENCTGHPYRLQAACQLEQRESRILCRFTAERRS